MRYFQMGILFTLIILLTISIVSAGFFDFFKKDVRLAPSDTTDVRVKINDAPTIFTPPSISPVTLSAGGFVAVAFQFTAEDLDGNSDLVDATAAATFSKSGETTRTAFDGINDGVDGCVFNSNPTANRRTYDCTISMEYYDENAANWVVTVSVDDSFGDTGTDNSATFTVQLLRDISVTPATVNFPTTTDGATNVISTDDSTITNNGNWDQAGEADNVQITAYDLVGETTPGETIPADRFNAEEKLTGTVCSAGTTLVDSVATGVPSIDLPRGASGNTRDVAYCITTVSGPLALSSQFYSTTGGTIWSIGLPP